MTTLTGTTQSETDCVPITQGATFSAIPVEIDTDPPAPSRITYFGSIADKVAASKTGGLYSRSGFAVRCAEDSISGRRPSINFLTRIGLRGINKRSILSEYKVHSSAIVTGVCNKPSQGGEAAVILTTVAVILTAAAAAKHQILGRLTPLKRCVLSCRRKILYGTLAARPSHKLLSEGRHREHAAGELYPIIVGHRSVCPIAEKGPVKGDRKAVFTKPALSCASNPRKTPGVSSIGNRGGQIVKGLPWKVTNPFPATRFSATDMYMTESQFTPGP